VPSEENRTGVEAQHIDGLVQRNIQALVRVRKEINARRSLNERIVDAVTAFAGSILFAYVHAIAFGGWILVNSGLIPWFRPVDPFPFVMLAMVASVEAIFLSTFVLISQNRAARISESRAELDLQINLLAEHELTEILRMVEGMSKQLGVPIQSAEVEVLKEVVDAERVLDHIESAKES
jgi:uncharacterized membrane protein